MSDAPQTKGETTPNIQKEKIQRPKKNQRKHARQGFQPQLIMKEHVERDEKTRKSKRNKKKKKKKKKQKKNKKKKKKQTNKQTKQNKTKQKQKQKQNHFPTNQPKHASSLPFFLIMIEIVRFHLHQRLCWGDHRLSKRLDSWEDSVKEEFGRLQLGDVKILIGIRQIRGSKCFRSCLGHTKPHVSHVPSKAV
jgi:hypothetical protein